MTYLLIIAATTLAGAFVMSLLPDSRSPVLYDRLLVAGLGAATGMVFGLISVTIMILGG